MKSCPSCGKPTCGNWAACARRKQAADEKAEKVAAGWDAVVLVERLVRREIDAAGCTLAEFHKLPPDKIGEFRRLVAANFVDEVEERARLRKLGSLFFGTVKKR
jgi:K+-sensing histidine kinase KdpD